MNLFELFVKIGVDDKASPAMKNTQKNSETLANKMKSMSAQFESAQKNIDNLTKQYNKSAQKTGETSQKTQELSQKLNSAKESLETTKNKLAVLASQYDTAKKNVADLTKEFNKSAKETGASSKETQELAKKLDDAEKEAEQAKKALDGYNSELGETETKTKKAGGGLSNFASKLGKGLATAAKIGAAAVGAAAAGITALTTAAVNNYAEYEQLVGGVETLFKTSSDKVMGYAENAYKTAGLSANEYMETVTSFSASLLQSLGGDTEEAAKYADMAITDMSDNANKMGTSMEMIQNAYRGFSRANYTMLDNLALGYGGTKEEMQRLIADAAELSDTVDAQSMSFDNIVEAIHVVQTEMGITGTTAKEAASTIQGSVGMMKSSWANLVTGIADDNADFETLIGNFVESVGIAAGNILPRIEQSLIGVGDLITSLAPVAVNAISDLIDDVLPSVLKAGISLLTAVGDGIISNFGYLVQTAFDLILYLSDSLISGADGIIDGAVALVESLAMWIEEYSDVLIEKAVVLIMTIVRGLIENLPKIAVAALEIIRALALGIVDNIPEIVKQIPTIISSIVNGFSNAMPDIVSIGKDIVKGVWKGISGMIKWFTDKVKGFFSGIVDGVKDTLGIHSPSKVFAGIGGFMAEGLADGWDKEYNGIKRSIEKDLNFGTATVDFDSSALSKKHSVVGGTFSGLSNSAGENITIVVQSVLDGKVIGETAYKYNQNRARAYGT